MFLVREYEKMRNSIIEGFYCMAQIICPNCKTEFTVDESDYLAIVQQVRTSEFEKEVEARLKTKELELDAVVAKATMQLELSYKDKIAEKDQKIAQIEASLKTKELEKKNEISQAIKDKDEEIARLKADASAFELQKNLAVSQARETINEELTEKNEMVTKLQNQIDNTEAKHTLEMQTQKALYESQTKLYLEEIERLKEFKQSLSTKAIGESLEVFCHNEFDKIRSVAFPKAYFEKDNDASNGSKGDFIFRDFDGDIELVSIMFEMKNEAENTEKKHKNEDFFAKLDKDRNQKGCEYAVLVTTLEPDNDLYNGGIVDVSHRFPKMYVIRPQFFIPLISVLRNVSLKALEYKKELSLVKAQNIDITNFENNLELFKASFDRNYGLAQSKFETAISQIDKAIELFKKIKENLLGSQNQLRIANQKADGLTIKKLVKNNPTMQLMFEEVKNQNNED